MRSKGVTYDEKGEVVSCTFCRIHSGEEPGRIEYNDSRYVVFRTIAPATKLHLLVTPRKHIRNMNSLSGIAGAKLLYNMKQIGMIAVTNLTGDENLAIAAKFCFHMPPYNSIDHLHLHVIVDPRSMNMFNRIKYPSNDLGFCRKVDSLIQEFCPNFPEILKSITPGELFEESEIYL